MDAPRWQRIQTLFHKAAELPESEQEAFLKSSCAGDDALISEVLAMLEADHRSGSLLDLDMAHVAHQMLTGADPLPSTREFGPYLIKEVLGEGGMGVVYLAERKDLGNQVAIKILRDAWLSPARRERFASEQRMLAQLNHPSIARLYDADTLADGTPWFVMEYVDGLPLTDYCQKQNCSIERRLQLFRQVCEAVQYAHGHAVIHRDLKPSNIFVKEDGSVRLLDFGIAKQLESLDTPVDHTRTVVQLMTPAYAAPEQMRGESVGAHTDVYSLGVILYQLLTDRLPFEFSRLTPLEAVEVVTEQEAGKPSTVESQFRSALSRTAWADLDVLCLTAMHKDPARRYRSVEALMRDIDHYLKGEPLEAQPDSLPYRVGKFVRRNRRAVSAAALVFLIVTGLVVFFTLRLARARNIALAEAARVERIQHFMMNLFEGGDEAAGPADSLRVTTLVDRGVQEAETLNTDPKVQAELFENLGSIYQKLGKLDRADSLLRRALEQRKSLFGADSLEAAESLIELGLLRDSQGKFDEAERLVRQGLDIDRRKLPPNHAAVGRATATLGRVLEDRGRYPQAIEVLEQAVRMQSQEGNAPSDLAETLTELANSHFYAGHYQTSESLNRRVMAMDRQLYGERHPHVADDLINLGAIQFDLGHYKEAEQYDRQALDIVRSFYGEDHPETASTLTLLGRALVAQGRDGDAAAILEQALAVQEHVYGKIHPRVASALNELGNAAKQLGNLDEAEADFKRAAEIYRSVYGGKHYYIGIAVANLAGVYVERKQYPKAEALFREALGIYSQSLSPDHLNVGIGRVRLGHVLVLEHRYSEAEGESRAGYEILMKQSSSPAKWLRMAREDLAEEYGALKQPEKAREFSTELTAAAKN
ncbi:MAG: serine/threonine-protein kinase [Acidobacteriia bacterium]|nr:serine/threonine-protein kinase [Terriglobia bacterium]